MTTDIVDTSSTRWLTESQDDADFSGNQRVRQELDTPTRERVITLASEPIIDYLSTKWYLYLLLLLARTTDHRLEICCSIERTNWQLSVNNWHTTITIIFFHHDDSDDGSRNVHPSSSSCWWWDVNLVFRILAFLGWKHLMLPWFLGERVSISSSSSSHKTTS